MIHRLYFRHVLALVFVGVASSAQAGLISLNVCPAGTTSNQTVYGTVLSGGVANWSGASYRDYEFDLRTTSGTATFDDFSVYLSAQLRNQTLSYNSNAGNALRASLWTGSVVPNPLLANALTTITVSNSQMTSSGYSALVQLTGSVFSSPQTISTSPSTFFFRIWAEGTINQGYQTKMASLTSEMQSVTMSPDPTIDGRIDVDTDSDGNFDLVDPMQEIVPVPEIDPAGAGSIAALIAGAIGLLERRRAPRRG